MTLDQFQALLAITCFSDDFNALLAGKLGLQLLALAELVFRMMTVMRSIVPTYIGLAGIYLAILIPASASVMTITPLGATENSWWMVPGPVTLPVGPQQAALPRWDCSPPAGPALPLMPAPTWWREPEPQPPVWPSAWPAW
jgi:hypothetical protein